MKHRGTADLPSPVRRSAGSSHMHNDWIASTVVWLIPHLRDRVDARQICVAGIGGFRM